MTFVYEIRVKIRIFLNYLSTFDERYFYVNCEYFRIIKISKNNIFKFVELCVLEEIYLYKFLESAIGVNFVRR